MGKAEFECQKVDIFLGDLDTNNLIGYLSDQGYRIFEANEKGMLTEVDYDFEDCVEVEADFELDTDDIIGELEFEDLEKAIEEAGCHVVDGRPIDLRDLNGSDLRRHLCDKLGLSCLTSKADLLKHLDALMF